MSYYDDASLMFLAGGGAQKDGKAYSIKPVPVYGSELVTNGDFATDSDWIKSSQTTISNGKARILSTDGSFQSIKQNGFDASQGKTIKFTIEITDIQSGQLKVSFAGGGTNTNIPNSVGTHNLYVLNDGTIGQLSIGRVSGVTDVTIDNVSVKEVLVGDGDFTFTRGSNLAATRVDAAGLIEKGRENLFLQSNSFDTTWSTSNSSVTSGQSGYDGSSDAWLLENVSGTGAFVRQDKSVNGVQTASVYAKSGNVDFVYFRLGGSSSRGLFVDLSNGTISSTFGTLIDYNIDSVGNGWYRISVTYEGNLTNTRIYASASGGTSTSLGDNILIQDAQLEVGLAATEVIETTTTTGTAGILENTPRFDYSNGASCPSLLLEPSRTNLIKYSEYFGGWTNDANTSLTANAIKSPSGFVDAYKMSAGTSNARQGRILNVSVSGSLALSIYAKKGGYSVVQLTDAVDASLYANFDLENGLLGNYNSCTPSIEDAGDGWYRCIITWTASVNINKVRISIAESTTEARLVSFAGNGIDGVYIWGAMVESNASYATSYIPNNSGTGTITRAADVCGGAGDANTFNSTEGVLYVEIAALVDAAPNRRISINSGDYINSVLINLKNSSNQIGAIIKVSNSVKIDLTHTLTDVTATNKIALKYKANDVALWVNGVEVQSVNSFTAITANTLSAVSFNRGDGGDDFYGNVKQVLTFNTALSDTDLAALTTI